MAIKNYSSNMAPAESLGKIQQVLAENGANRIQMEYDNGKPSALSFAMWINEVEVSFRLTVDVEGMLRAMESDKKVPKSQCNREQAEKTAWKNKLEWIQIQLAEIASNQARMEQLLLGYAVTNDGQTLFERLKTNQQLLIGE